jgi:hypothetical protein
MLLMTTAWRSEECTYANIVYTLYLPSGTSLADFPISFSIIGRRNNNYILRRTECTECHAFPPVVRIGFFDSKGGGAHSLVGGGPGGGGANSNDVEKAWYSGDSLIPLRLKMSLSTLL